MWEVWLSVSRIRQRNDTGNLQKIYSAVRPCKLDIVRPYPKSTLAPLVTQNILKALIGNSFPPKLLPPHFLTSQVNAQLDKCRTGRYCYKGNKIPDPVH